MRVEDYEGQLSETASSTLEQMLQAGYLTKIECSGKTAEPPLIRKPVSHFSRLTRDKSFRPNIGHVVRFLVGSAIADWELRFLDLEKTIRRAETKKSNNKFRDRSSDVKEMSRLVTIFLMLRPYYPRNYLCLYDSLALVKFLARYHFYPTWIYGVTTEPFKAHCWVQGGEQCFNEQIEVARIYQPIMAV